MKDRRWSHAIRRNEDSLCLDLSPLKEYSRALELNLSVNESLWTA